MDRNQQKKNKKSKEIEVYCPILMKYKGTQVKNKKKYVRFMISKKNKEREIKMQVFRCNNQCSICKEISEIIKPFKIVSKNVIRVVKTHKSNFLNVKSKVLILEENRDFYIVYGVLNPNGRGIVSEEAIQKAKIEAKKRFPKHKQVLV